MERNKNNPLRNFDEDDFHQWPDSDSAERHATSTRDEPNPDAGPNEDLSAKKMAGEEHEHVRHHEAFVNKRYQSFKNRSSADDQPRTDTGA